MEASTILNSSCLSEIMPNVSSLGAETTVISKCECLWSWSNFLSEGASSMMSFPVPLQRMPKIIRQCEFIHRQLKFIKGTNNKHSRAGQLQWMMFCSETSNISTSTIESLLCSGSRSICTRLSGSWQQAKLAVWRDDEKFKMAFGGNGLHKWHSIGGMRFV